MCEWWGKKLGGGEEMDCVWWESVAAHTSTLNSSWQNSLKMLPNNEPGMWVFTEWLRLQGTLKII